MQSSSSDQIQDAYFQVRDIEASHSSPPSISESSRGAPIHIKISGTNAFNGPSHFYTGFEGQSEKKPEGNGKTQELLHGNTAEAESPLAEEFGQLITNVTSIDNDGKFNSGQTSKIRNESNFRDTFYRNGTSKKDANSHFAMSNNRSSINSPVSPLRGPSDRISDNNTESQSRSSSQIMGMQDKFSVQDSSILSGELDGQKENRVVPILMGASENIQLPLHGADSFSSSDGLPSSTDTSQHSHDTSAKGISMATKTAHDSPHSPKPFGTVSTPPNFPQIPGVEPFATGPNNTSSPSFTTPEHNSGNPTQMLDESGTMTASNNVPLHPSSLSEEKTSASNSSVQDLVTHSNSSKSTTSSDILPSEKGTSDVADSNTSEQHAKNVFLQTSNRPLAFSTGSAPLNDTEHAHNDPTEPLQTSSGSIAPPPANSPPLTKASGNLLPSQKGTASDEPSFSHHSNLSTDTAKMSPVVSVATETLPTKQENDFNAHMLNNNSTPLQQHEGTALVDVDAGLPSSSSKYTAVRPDTTCSTAEKGLDSPVRVHCQGQR